MTSTQRQILTRRLTSQRGMTLIEIMVVIAIIGILASAIGFGVVNWLKESKTQTASIQLSTVAQALDGFYATKGDYPSSLGDLTNGKRPLLKEKNLKDPWNKDLVYNFPATKGDGDFDLCSKGPDKRAGTEDDICRE
jgi:general secretion pathway protein G